MTQQINYLFNNLKWGGFQELHITDPWIHKYIKVSGSLVFLFLLWPSLYHFTFFDSDLCDILLGWKVTG